MILHIFQISAPLYLPALPACRTYCHHYRPPSPLLPSPPLPPPYRRALDPLCRVLPHRALIAQESRQLRNRQQVGVQLPLLLLLPLSCPRSAAAATAQQGGWRTPPSWGQ